MSGDDDLDPEQVYALRGLAKERHETPEQLLTYVATEYQGIWGFAGRSPFEIITELYERFHN